MTVSEAAAAQRGSADVRHASADDGRARTADALRWLAHPVSVLALVTMVVNDHVLKHQFGSWWTGKLSDVAGLVFFPALVAVALAAARVKRADLAAVVVTGLGFAWVKVLPDGADAASAVLSGAAGPSVVRADPTDLLALPALGVALWVAGRARARREGPGTAARRSVGVALLPVAVLASAATGAVPPEATVYATEHGWVLSTGVCLGETCGPYALVDGRWTGSPLAAPLEPQRMDCSAADQQWCLRAADEEMAVDESRDGGRTWERVWELTGDDASALIDAYGVGDESLLRVTGVAFVTPDQAGATDWAALASAGRDGVVVLHADGMWERMGFAGVPCCQAWPLAELPTRWMPYGALIPPAIAWALAAALALGPLAVVVARRRVRARGGESESERMRRARGVASAAAIFGMAAAVLWGSDGLTERWDNVEVILQPSLALIVSVGAVTAGAIAAGRAGVWRRRLRWRAALAAVVTGLAVGGAAYVIPGPWVVDVVVAAAVFAAGVLAAARWLERLPETSAPVADDAATWASGWDEEARERAGAAATGLPWTLADAATLAAVGRSRAASDVVWVARESARRGLPVASKDDLAQRLGRLAGSGLVTVRHGVSVVATAKGRAVVREARRARRASSGGEARMSRAEAMVAALGRVECLPTTVDVRVEVP